ncbi:hypothetical protein [Escherichia sp. E4385]|uniref:hypothetical protein n=1 Tax=Escherichia sp. E4385 TaxID=2040639 RepID=UPI00107F2C6C|nr:hypothetical protein [Escherichia sp. E4385]TGC17328.1 hypothetical protein CRU79_07315 [Escherichia sp. E4385]TLI94348.1 hypothetical protein FEK49_23745 [Escherichia sp. E4385]
MDNKDKAWLLALAFSTTHPREITPEDFLSEVESAENEFLSLLNKLDAEKPDDSLKVWEKLGSSK